MLVTAALLIGRLVRLAVRLVRPGGGSALPGLVVSKIVPGLVYKTLNSFNKGLVIVTGTAGKSTTTKMTVAIVRAHGISVFTNPSTANIEQGFFSTIIKNGNLRGQVPGQIAILEMDEAHAAAVVEKVPPRFSAILNVFEDQLDRFIDPSLVKEKLKKVVQATTESVVLNGDDQNCLEMVSSSNTDVDFFGLGSNMPKIDYAKTYSKPLPKPELEFEATELSDRTVKVASRFGSQSIELPSRGVHFASDAVAALTLSAQILGESFDFELACQTLNEMPPVFSRGEIRTINNQDVEFILIQNPISLQLNIDNLPKTLGPIMFAIGRDVHDPSWLWTVDYKNLPKVNLVSGFNYADAALALLYNGVEVDRVEDDYFKAIDDFMSDKKPAQGRKTVLYSADAMRRLRRYLGFTDPEDVQRV